MQVFKSRRGAQKAAKRTAGSLIVVVGFGHDKAYIVSECSCLDQISVMHPDTGRELGNIAVRHLTTGNLNIAVRHLTTGNLNGTGGSDRHAI